jgi:Domain of unknown function (DUF6484)
MKKAVSKSRGSAAVSVVTSLPARGHRVCRVVDVCENGWLIECAPGASPLRARTTLSLTGEAMRAAAAANQEVLVVFENESADKPIVVGLLAPPSPAEKSAEELDATVDGRRVTFDARDEIVLRCGQASITLRRNGRIVIRGTYVETRSRGVNRIKGGSVQIN